SRVMSPSESDLRAALHDGEGGNLDVDQLILGARAHAAQRRMRLLSTAAVVAVVASAGVGGAALLRSGSSPESDAGEKAANRSHSAYDATAGNKRADAVPGAQGAASGVPCPSSPPNYLLPGGGGTTQFGAPGPLFSKPV